MPCTSPQDCWPACPPKKGIVFSPQRSYAGAKAFSVPCGQCMSCRLARAAEWSVRLTHEASQHEFNSFLTLTYDDAHLPSDWSVRVREVQLFMKRLRKALGLPLRYFACGEYGDRGLRPHYHAVLFGYDFPDKKPWRRTGSGFVTYRSAELEKVWTFGHSEIGSVTTQSAGYVARYCVKKVNGELAGDRYTRRHPVTDFPWQVCPEFVTMSRKPGIGSAWYDEFNDDAFPSDFVIVEGRKAAVPRYYGKKLQARSDQARAESANSPFPIGELTPLMAERVKLARKENAAKHADNNTTRRLLARAESQLLRADRLHRELDEIS